MNGPLPDSEPHSSCSRGSRPYPPRIHHYRNLRLGRYKAVRRSEKGFLVKRQNGSQPREGVINVSCKNDLFNDTRDMI